MSGIWDVQTRVLYGLSPHDELRFTTLSTFLCLAGRLAVLVLPLSFAQTGLQLYKHPKRR